LFCLGAVLLLLGVAACQSGTTAAKKGADMVDPDRDAKPKISGGAKAG
jgi:hypothetical protein